MTSSSGLYVSKLSALAIKHINANGEHSNLRQNSSPVQNIPEKQIQANINYSSKSLDISNAQMVQTPTGKYYMKNNRMRLPNTSDISTAAYAAYFNAHAHQRIAALGSMTMDKRKVYRKSLDEKIYRQNRDSVLTHNANYSNIKEIKTQQIYANTDNYHQQLYQETKHKMNNNKSNSNSDCIQPPVHMLTDNQQHYQSFYDERSTSPMPNTVPSFNMSHSSSSAIRRRNPTKTHAAAVLNVDQQQINTGPAYAATPVSGRYLARSNIQSIRKNTMPINTNHQSSTAGYMVNNKSADGNGSENTNVKRITFSLKNGNGSGCEKFVLYDYYQPIKFLGKGAYAVVIAATDLRTNAEIAIKKNKGVFNALSDAKRILREIKLMLHFEHENIMPLLSVIPPQIHEREDFEDVYLLMPRMETTLAKVIHSKQVLTEKHKQYFIFQLLRGLKYIHSAGVIHRDLKPENILINGSDCKLRISDFGLSRGVLKNGNEHLALTEYVVTRWYRAPEIMCSSRQYDEGVDVWGLGCIMSELYLRKPIFPGSNHIEQLRLIFSYLGTPVDCDWIKTSDARRWVGGLERNLGQNFREVFPEANKYGCDLIQRMLSMNPNRRITVQQALEHPWINPLYRTAISSLRKAKTRTLKKINMLTHEITDNEIEMQMDVCREKFNLEFEFERQINTIFGVRHMMYEELHEFAKKRAQKARRIKKNSLMFFEKVNKNCQNTNGKSSGNVVGSSTHNRIINNQAPSNIGSGDGNSRNYR